MLAFISSFGLLFFGFFLLLGLASLAFWLWMLIDCIQNEKSEGNDKLIWILVIVFAGWIGALIYFFVRKMPRSHGAIG